ncbi:hypothetical protein [Hahella sp. NBU794]|uniref:hypothetical protein n=1 Tax=Hahella sp. NBU794 TaxID=3422590 RepID=UPI003D6E78C7
MADIQIEGVSLAEILGWTEAEFDALVLTDKPLVVNIGSASVLGQFSYADKILTVELAQIDGGGEGVLPAITRIAKKAAQIKNAEHIECVVHAIHCANPNLKLRAHLERTGFEIKQVEGKGEAYFKRISV